MDLSKYPDFNCKLGLDPRKNRKPQNMCVQLNHNHTQLSARTCEAYFSFVATDSKKSQMHPTTFVISSSSAV
jgi:hypothetical protein